MAQVAVEMTLAEAQAIQALRNVVREQDKSESKWRDIAKAAKEAQREQVELGRRVSAAYRSVQTPLERYKQTQLELDVLVKKGAIDQQTYARAVAAARREMDASSMSTRQRVAAEEDLARRATATYQAVQTPMERYRQRVFELGTLARKGAIDQETYNRAVRQAGDEYNRSSAAGEKAFGARALGQLQSYAMGLVSIGVVAGKVTQALDEMQQKREDAAQKQAEAKFSLGSLKQVADMEGPYNYEGLKQKGEELYLAGAASSLEEGYRTVFEIKSAEMMGEYDLYKQLKQSRMIQQPGVLAQSAATLQTSMGKAETGDVRSLVAKGLAAAEIAPGTTETVLQAASESGVAAGEMGLSDEELLAALAVTAKASGSSELAGTRLNRLLLSLQEMGAKGKKASVDVAFGGMAGADEALAGFADEDGTPSFDFEGKSLMEMIRQVQKKNLDDAELQKLFGRQEGLIAYRLLLRNADQYEQMQKRITEAGKGGPLDERLRIRDPQLDVELSASQAKGREELSRRSMGTQNQMATALQAELEADMREGGASAITTYMAQKFSSAYRWIYGDEKYNEFARENIQKGIRDYRPPQSEESARNMNEAARDLKDAAGNLRQATTGGVSLGRPNEDR